MTSIIPWVETNDNVFLRHKSGPRIAAAVTCVGSMIGSMLIILSYCLFKELRNQTRLILVHLSCMDFAVALANFVGAVAYFDKDYMRSSNNDPSEAVQVSCTAQAAVALYCTLSSILWTLSVAIYMYLHVVTHRDAGARFSQVIQWSLYAINYLVPLLITIWMLAIGHLGYSPYDSSGWCTLIVVDPVTREHDVIVSVFGYDMWIFISMVLVPVLYISVKIHIKQQYSLLSEKDSELRSIWRSAELKITLIPMLFLFLRLWSLISNVMYIYTNVDHASVPKWINDALLYLSGIGDSGQGLANGILFMIFTREARQLILEKCLWCRKKAARLDKYGSNVESMKSPSEFTPIRPSQGPPDYLAFSNTV